MEKLLSSLTNTVRDIGSEFNNMISGGDARPEKIKVNQIRIYDGDKHTKENWEKLNTQLNRVSNLVNKNVLQIFSPNDISPDKYESLNNMRTATIKIPIDPLYAKIVDPVDNEQERNNL